MSDIAGRDGWMVVVVGVVERAVSATMAMYASSVHYTVYIGGYCGHCIVITVVIPTPTRCN